MHLATALCLALADVDTRLRREFPDVFARVDAVKARPGWHPHQQDQDSTRLPETVFECAWCGDFFMPAKACRTQTCCSHSCRGRFQAWNRRRRAA